MAIQLYRKGNTHTVRGVECELRNFRITELDAQLKEGWCTSVEGLNDAVPEAEEESSEETEDKVLNPVRQAAKDKGIEGWEKKRIKTLENELEEG